MKQSQEMICPKANNGCDPIVCSKGKLHKANNNDKEGYPHHTCPACIPVPPNVEEKSCEIGQLSSDIFNSDIGESIKGAISFGSARLLSEQTAKQLFDMGYRKVPRQPEVSTNECEELEKIISKNIGFMGEPTDWETMKLEILSWHTSIISRINQDHAEKWKIKRYRGELK